MNVPNDLTAPEPDALYDLLDDLALTRQRVAYRRDQEATEIKAWCKAQRARVKAELRRRKLPGTRPGDERVYGLGVAGWQRAGRRG